MATKLRFIGVALIIISVIGFLTVADDLRHKGELLAVGSILLLGLLSLLVSLIRRQKR